MTTKEEYYKLVKEVEKHDRLYYMEYKPVITDYEYDQLLKKLEQIEKEHPNWRLPTSPTQRLGDALTHGFKQQKHDVPMLSLANTYSKQELEEYVQRVHKLMERKDVTFCAELKMDGVAVSVRYEEGIFVRALTRGDGKKGDDITQNMKTIRSLPLHLTGSHLPKVLEIRGEVFMTHKVFQEQNARKEEAGEEPWANPRNATAGSLKLLDPKEVAERRLSAIFYGIASEPYPVDTQFEVHQFLEKIGLPSFTKEERRRCKTLEEISEFADFIEKKRRALPFDIDGMVVKVDELRWYDRLGTTGKSPRFAIAYKFCPEQARTRIEAITVQVGRTGVLTPVAELTPVPLAGSTISRATLHNREEVQRKDIRVGDVVIIEKGGDVIPKVVEVDHSQRPHGTHSWHMPKSCPSCGAHVVHIPGEVAVRCPNSEKCPEQQVRRIAFFASKDAMDIAHFGEKVVEQLVEKGFVRSLSDIYSLTEKELSQLEGFKEKSIENLLKGIEASRHVSLARFILALGIKSVGEGTAEILAEAAGDIETLAHMSEEALAEIDQVGEKTAHLIVEYFKEPAHLKQIHALLKAGVRPEPPQGVRIKGHAFEGKTFVLTGTLQDYTRSAATALIKERGGKVSGSVSKNTDFLLAGDEPGSKLDKAHALKVKVLTEREFKHLL